MPLYNYHCDKCDHTSTEFVWGTSARAVPCPRCGEQMRRLFTCSNMPLLNRQKPIPFKFDPKEPSADKSIWKSVLTDAKKGTLHPGEFEYWKKETEKRNPELIL